MILVSALFITLAIFGIVMFSKGRRYGEVLVWIGLFGLSTLMLISVYLNGVGA